MSEDNAKLTEFDKTIRTSDVEIGTLRNELGDRWRCYIDSHGDLWLLGSDIDWERRNAEAHGLVLDSAEYMWLEACILVARAIRSLRAVRFAEPGT